MVQEFSFSSLVQQLPFKIGIGTHKSDAHSSLFVGMPGSAVDSTLPVGVGSSRLHSSLRLTQLLQGASSSHFTRRCLQRLHPFRDFFDLRGSIYLLVRFSSHLESSRRTRHLLHLPKLAHTGSRRASRTPLALSFEIVGR